MDPENLHKVPLFAALSPDDLRRISTFATEDSFASGSALMREGDFSTDMIAIETGTADVVQHGRTLASLGPGDLVGEIGLLGKERRTASVIATSSMRVIRLTKWDVRRLPRDTRDRLTALVEERRARDRERDDATG